MTALTEAPPKPLLDRLFAEADAIVPATAPSVADCWNAMTAADNADDNPDYLGRVRNARLAYLSVPFGEDIELSMKLG